MAHMNKNTFFTSALFVCALTSSAWAMSGDTSTYQGAVFNAEAQKPYEAVYNGSPRLFSLGGYTQGQKRDMDIHGTVQKWNIRETAAYVGMDVTRWLTVRGGGGQNKVDVGNFSGGSDGEWIAGGTLRLLDYFAMDPMIGDESYWLGINLDGQYTGARSHLPTGTVTWNGISAALLFSLTARTERWGFLDRISIFAGPAYSGIVGDDGIGFGGTIREDKSIGGIIGLAFALSDNLTVKTEAQNFGSSSFGLGVSFHF